MEILRTVVYLLMLASAIGIVVLVLLQHGKGADMGTGFGAGASGSLFGATGSANFLSRATAVLAVVFFSCTLALSYFAGNRPKPAPSGADSFLPAQSIPASQPALPSGPLPAQAPAPVPAGQNAPAAVPPEPGKSNEIPK